MTGFAAIAAGLFPLASEVRGDAATERVELSELRSNRPRMMLDLSEPIALCVAKHDTAHPAFHGCIDWHSAVHGTWALIAYGWATGDHRYRPLVDTILRPDLLAKEREYVASNPDFEMPYGRAWFLRLAIAYRRAFGTETLDGFADDVARSIIDHYSHSAPNPKSVAYRSASWALVNLYDYGASRGDSHVLDFVRKQVRTHFLTADPCPLKTVEIDTREFMAICTNWAWLVQKVLPKEEFITWLERFMPPDMPLQPIISPASVHQAGLNFSRCWGLWELYRATGDVRFLKLYLSHFKQNYSEPRLWKGDYKLVAHWVAQFGMLGLVQTYNGLP